MRGAWVLVGAALLGACRWDVDRLRAGDGDGAGPGDGAWGDGILPNADAFPTGDAGPCPPGSMIAPARGATVAWNGAEVAVAFVSQNVVELQRYAGDTPLPLVMVHTGGAGLDAATRTDVAWAGNQWAIAHDGNGVGLSLVDSTGGYRGTTPLTTVGTPLSVAWSGSTLAMAYMTSDSDDEISFDRFDSAGTPIGGARITNNNTESAFPDLVWAASGWGVVWADERNGGSCGVQHGLWVQQVNATGGTVGGNHELMATVCDSSGNADSGAPVAAWNGSSISVVWADPRLVPRDLWYVGVDLTSGTPVAPEHRLTMDGRDSITPRLVWNGAEHGLVWADGDVWFVRLDAGGTATELPRSLGPGTFPDVAWAGSCWAIVWQSSLDIVSLGYLR